MKPLINGQLVTFPATEKQETNKLLAVRMLCAANQAVGGADHNSHTQFTMLVVATGAHQCTLQLPEVHMFIGILWFVQYIWEIMICANRARILNQCQLLCNSTNFSVHPRRLFLSSKCSSKVVLNDGIDFKAISWQTSELTAPEACHLSLYMGMVLCGTFQ